MLFNYFSGESDSDERFMFASTYKLNEYAKKAGTSFEKAVVHLLLGQIVAYFSNIDFHEKTRGCIMDFCEERSDIIEGLKEMKLCSWCQKKIPDGDFKNALMSILNWLQK